MSDKTVTVIERLGCLQAVSRLFLFLDRRIGPSDPAPWTQGKINDSPLYHHREPDELVRQGKVQERAALVMARALLSGDLVAQVTDLDTGESRRVPGWMWEKFNRVEHWSGKLPMPVVLPDDWLRFKNQEAFLNESEFNSWLSSDRPLVFGDLPILPRPYDAEAKPAQTSQREPPHEAYVTLSEALSWIAFGYAVDSKSLDRAGWEGSFGEPVVYRSRLSNAVRSLTSKAAGADVELVGRWASDAERGSLTRKIEPTQLIDFSKFDAECDGLRVGVGIVRCDMPISHDPFFYGRTVAPYFRDVKVGRAGLMNCFPASQGAGQNVLAQSVRFDDLGRKQWMNAQPSMTADAAHKIYKTHPSYCGTKLPEFRQEWRETKGTKRGRPLKSTNK